MCKLDKPISILKEPLKLKKALFFESLLLIIHQKYVYLRAINFKSSLIYVVYCR